MTRRFTPGPWRVQVCTGPARGAFNVWAGDAVVAGVPHPDQPYSGARSAHEAKGNARLIAAAPDLYEALRAVRRHLDSEEETAEVEALIDHALAKAEGK